MFKSEIEKLKQEIDDKYDKLTAIALKNLFALGCFLHLKGETRAGREACESAMRAIGFKEGVPIEFDTLLENLSGNEKDFISGIRAHMQITALIRSI